MRDDDEYSVVWSARAQADLRSIRAYIADDAPIAAESFADELAASVAKLRVFPGRGRKVDSSGHELVFGAYIIRYTIARRTLNVIYIRHGARRR